MLQVQGIIPPIVTPMTPDEEVDHKKLKEIIDWQIECGVNGIFVMGTTGECYALSDEEKQRIVATAVEHVNKRVPVYAGTGAETTREAIRHTKMAEREGVNGVSVITPYFVMPNQSEIADHYRRVAAATSLPVILYSNPATCGGLKIDPDTIAKLAQVPNIVAVKDSSGDLTNLIETVRLVPDTFAVLQGRDTLIAPALMFGARGAVPASCNIAPKLLVEIYESFVAGDIEKCQSAQARLSPVRLALMIGTAPGVVKQAMALCGRDVGPSRSPIAPLPPEKRQQLAKILGEAGLLA
ncbi:4-hydroxy-tetrahydrodipicolinate synthase [Zavarzinella formosa]|uniref:4-hydroxy-tetrahydrodipicolinate synthase n=1 Tax=Zavarzinella formosa TaxID=360055 RepID=UPI0002FD067C|nr:4-hydroxy-tetrahydrodipicolinate synthase [Zavarzinella formosa]